MTRDLLNVTALCILTAPVFAENCTDFFDAGSDFHVEPQSTAMALSSPDCYSWRLFVALNWPADPATKSADPTKDFGADGPVVWETWRNVRNTDPETVFRLDGSDPGPWLTGAVDVDRNIENFDDEPIQQLMATSGMDIEVDPISAQFRINETRMNKESYEFVRENELYHLEGQVALFNSGVEAISFPLAAKEIKAQWREIEETDKPRYHWAEVTKLDGTTQLYGMTALHITTKDLPNWLWATFEHIDNKVPESDGGREGNEGWLLPSSDRFACPNAPENCDTAPEVAVGTTKWRNYVLRGTQVDFIDSVGNATILANSQPEEGFQLSSSCITCHAMASIGADGARLNFFETRPPTTPGPVGFVGSPNPAWFRDPGLGGNNLGKLRYTQLDFVWSLFRAQSSSRTDGGR